jgi:tRNA-(ms[2]io[6]A)-hydroxylase
LERRAATRDGAARPGAVDFPAAVCQRAAMRLPPDPHAEAWLEVVLADTDTLLMDHAHCERKAAGTAMALVARYPDRSDLVAAMAELAAEELGHFQEVHDRIRCRGLALGPDPGDPYAKALVGQVRGDPNQRLVDRLLISGLIETRSFQRLRLLGDHHPDPELAEMFERFAKAEAGHGALFVSLAKRYGEDPDVVQRRHEELEAFEIALLEKSPVRCAMH